MPEMEDGTQGLPQKPTPVSKGRRGWCGILMTKAGDAGACWKSQPWKILNTDTQWHQALLRHRLRHEIDGQHHIVTDIRHKRHARNLEVVIAPFDRGRGYAHQPLS
jgi:hypothetical protein